MKKIRTKTRIRIYKTKLGYKYMDSSASSLEANLRNCQELAII